MGDLYQIYYAVHQIRRGECAGVDSICDWQEDRFRAVNLLVINIDVYTSVDLRLNGSRHKIGGNADSLYHWSGHIGGAAYAGRIIQPAAKKWRAATVFRHGKQYPMDWFEAAIEVDEALTKKGRENTILSIGSMEMDSFWGAFVGLFHWRLFSVLGLCAVWRLYPDCRNLHVHSFTDYGE